MIRSTITISNKLGLHARASSKFTQTATQFSSEVWVTRKERRVNGKSIMGLMMLAAGLGVTVKIDAQGEQCDLNDFGNKTCPSGNGYLSCTDDCKLDESTCDQCGDGQVDSAAPGTDIQVGGKSTRLPISAGSLADTTRPCCRQ